MNRASQFITLMLMLIATSTYAADCDSIAVACSPAALGAGEQVTDNLCVEPLAASDSVTVAPDTIAPKKKGLIAKIINYFEESNKPRRSKRFDFSVIGGPHYSSDTKFGIGLVAAGLYRTNMRDTVTPPSDVAIYADATTSMFFKLGVRGNHIMPGDRARLQYDVNFASNDTKFWGIGYKSDVNDDNESKYKCLLSEARASYIWRLHPSLFLGPMASFDYINGRHFEKPWLWEGESDRTFNFGVGFTLQYDNRDFLTNASHGVYLRLDQRFNPRFIGNKYAFSLTEFTAAWYHPLWKSATIAAELHGRLTYGNTPWGQLSTLGGSSNMRGYFEGRYRDKNEFDCCVELRQHIWHRNGVVAWVGAGTIFPKFSAMRWREVLPNYGVGYRWEFKKRVNVRLDLGFGRHQTGFIFSINEAF